MARPMLIVLGVALFLATGVAVASPDTEVRLPVQVNSGATIPESVVVAKGDHLWKISARYLDKTNPAHEVAPYWRQVIEVNVSHLQSGDPNLIYPGEVIEMPALSEQP